MNAIPVPMHEPAAQADPAALADTFRRAMGRFAGAVTLITTSENGRPSGMVATAVCSLSAEPPSILVCVNRSASCHDIILRRRIFAVNLPELDSKHVVERFSQQSGSTRFDPPAWYAGETGAPLLRGARVSLDCRVAMVHDGFSHSIVVGTVVAATMAPDGTGPCLLWHGHRFHAAQPLEA